MNDDAEEHAEGWTTEPEPLRLLGGLVRLAVVVLVLGALGVGLFKWYDEQARKDAATTRELEHFSGGAISDGPTPFPRPTPPGAPTPFPAKGGRR